MENPPPYAIESVDNALQLLLLLRRDGALRVSTAAEELGVARSTAHRLLAMLKYRGFVVQDTQRMYRPGAAFRELSAGSPVVALPALARPHLEWLAQQVGETVNLVTRTGTDTRFVESVEGTEVLRVGSRVGVVLPAHRTSGGKVLLADLSRSELEAVYPQHPAGSAELTRLRRSLSVVRRRGYGTNYEETEPGVIALGVAVRDAEAVAVAALTISAPKLRYPRGAIVDLLPRARAAAERIRRELIGG
jgi:IclR family acetate operon transcriptional repressor